MTILSSAGLDYHALAEDIKGWGGELGFQRVGITDIDLSEAESHLLDWLAAGHHGEMHYMQRHGTRRSRPAELVPGTLRVVSAAMDYWPEGDRKTWLRQLDHADQAYISCYAAGRDYHKVVRKKLQKLADHITERVGEFGYRVYCDSAPVLEKALAEKAGLGWIGKHTNLIDRHAGSWFFLGELYTDLPLPVDAPASNHCGSCRDCIDACPTGAIVAPYQLDARRCISYLTIELRGSIPEPLRPLIGNRIYGCDDCQLVCPWNKFAQTTREPDFAPRTTLRDRDLLELFAWDEHTFLQRTEGSAIRRIGYECWLRNIAVALGNSRASGAARNEVVQGLRQRRGHGSELVREHVAWALDRLAAPDDTVA